MAVALVLGGGAPNLPLMSGALLAMDDAGVEFDLVSTTGAGMLIGLMYASPKSGDRKATLRATREMGVHDAIYNVFPVNYKIFHKAGPMAEAYTKFHQSWLAAMPRENEAQRFMSDMAQFWMATFCPGDMSPKQKGLCQPPPWIDLVVDFEKLKEFKGEFLMSAFCIEDESLEEFEKAEITADHFKAALAMPLIYAPYKLNGKTYLEGSAFETLYFGQGGVMKKNLIDTVVYFDILGQRKLIAEPDSLYDAWVHSIINPLTRIAEMDSHNYKTVEAKAEGVELLRMPFRDNISDEQWPKVLDWSYSNMSTLFDIGYKTGKEFVEKHKDQILVSKEKTPKRVMEKLDAAGLQKEVLAIVEKADKRVAHTSQADFQKQFAKLAKQESEEIMEVLACAAQMFEKAPPPDKKTTVTV
ncbi:MAG: patatin-like phospholipase family protein [Roseobacter sp.]|jgi:predicted patatin/cPLA2 family phospholipase|nr:patatin-like phospholipase family protein [Roseobacter sp.]